MKEPTFLLALAIAGITVIVMVRTIAGAFNRGRASNSEIADLKEQLDDQAAQLADVQNRLDFAERLLARARDRSALEAGDKDK